MITAAPCPNIPDYDLIRVVGKGAYGDVWLARGITGVYRAVKVVWRDRFQEPQPFEREFRGLRDFARVPNNERRQLALLHVGRNEQAGYFYYVMELADDVLAGQRIDPERYEPLTLKRYLAQKNRLRVAEVVDYAVEITQALAELHAHGLVHRDIKPSNLVLVNGQPKLADIGLVAAVNATSVVGTEGFMPPEGPGTPSSDVYSLGKVLYELATNLDRKEFPRLPEDLLTLEDAPQLMELNEVIVRACDPSPKRRYPDADTMLHELRLLQEGRSLRRMRMTERGLARARRIATTFLIVAGIGFGGAFIERQRAEREADGRRAAEAERDRLARFLAYSGGLSRAQRALASGDFGRARELLRDTVNADEHELETPPFEWRALWQAAQGDPAIVLRENGPSVERVDFSSDGRWFAIHDNSKTTTIYDAVTREPVKVLHGLYRFGGFSFDGRWLLGTTPTHQLQAWNLDSGLPIGAPQGTGFNHPVCSFEGEGILLLAFQFSGRTDPPRLRVWDLSSQREVFGWTGITVHGARWETRLATWLIDDSGVSLVTQQLKGQNSFFREVYLPTNETSTAVPWPSPDDPTSHPIRNGFVARAIGAFKSPSPSEAKTIGELDGPNELSALSLSANRQTMVAGSTSGFLRILTDDPSTPHRLLTGHSGGITSIAFNVEGTQLITADSAGHVRLWTDLRSSTSAVVGDLPVFENASRPHFSANGRKLFVETAGGDVLGFSADDLELIQTWKGAQRILAITNEGAPISVDHRPYITKWSPNGLIAKEAALPFKRSESITTAMSRDGRTFVATGEDRDLLIGEPWTGQYSYFGDVATTKLGPISLAENGSYAAAVVDGVFLHLWDAQKRTKYSDQKFERLVEDISFSSDGRLLAVCFINGEVAIVDVVERRTLHMFRVSSAAVRATFAPDSTRLVCIARNGTLHIYRTSDWREVATLEDEPGHLGPQSRVASIAFSPDGRALAVHRHDGKLRLWRAP